MDFLDFGGFLPDLTSLVFMSTAGVCLPYIASPSLSLSSTTLRVVIFDEGIIPSFFHLKNPFLLSINFSNCACMELHWLWSLNTSSLSFFISICWEFTSRFDRQRAPGGSSPIKGLLVPLNEPLHSSCLLSLDCSEKITWITARTGKRSFWAAWSDASGDSFLLSINLHRSFLSCFGTPGCAYKEIH